MINIGKYLDIIIWIQFRFYNNVRQFKNLKNPIQKSNKNSSIQISLDKYRKMTSFYRSQQVDHYKLIIPRQNCWQIMNMLGQLDMIHIVKNNSPILSKPFTTQIRRCEQCLQKIYQLEQLLIRKHIYEPRTQFSHQELATILEMIANKYHQLNKLKSMSILDQIDEEIEQNFNSYQSFKKRADSLSHKLIFYRQNLAIIKAGQNLFGIKNFNSQIPIPNSDFSNSIFANSFQHQPQKGLTIKCGVISNAEQKQFSRTVFRITKGNSYIKFVQLNTLYDKLTLVQQNKSLYFVLVPAKADSYFQRRLSRFVNNYNQSMGQTYRLPTSNSDYFKILKQITQEFNQTQHLLSLVQKQLNLFYHKLLGVDQNQDLHDLAIKSHFRQSNDFKKIEMMKIYLLKQLQIFNQLNQMQLYNNFLQAEIYVRKSKVQQLQHRLVGFQKQTRQPSGHLIPIQPYTKKPPTLIPTNSYTLSAFQIVQTYGTPQYRQANPALFTTITFPFLFGVMFGDIAHGMILFVFGLLLVNKPDYVRKTIPILKPLVTHRYLIALMGFFAMYCGFVYNDFLSFSLNLFGSCYDILNATQAKPISRISNQCVYNFGLDPVWAVSQNSLNFVNSMKMKISVIIAVFHMTLGVLVKATNSLHFKRKVQFYFQFIPQLLFLVLVFGYMDFLIIFKWLKDWGFGNPHAPSIITTMINLPLAMGKTDTQCCHGGQPMWGTTGDTSQDGFQILILTISVLSIPVMLLIKPLHIISKIKKHKKNGNLHRQNSDSLQEQFEQEMAYLRQKMYESPVQKQQIEMVVLGKSVLDIQKQKNLDALSSDSRSVDSDPAQEEHDPSEIYVHQIIETIEFVLGCISNTASYLRLWALSLAHAQLSEVFLQKTIESSLESGYSGIFGMLALFPMFASVTFGVLMCMDVMECFLHTLRLHWVQFQNKFYKGDGYAFQSFNFITKINQQASIQRYQSVDKHKK